jgi:hypothetical protein
MSVIQTTLKMPSRAVVKDDKTNKSKYVYKPLQNARSTRLLQLLPSKFKGQLRGDLVEVNLDDKTKYEAISYSWDAQQPDRKVIIGNTYLLVTANCEDALHQLRRTFSPRTLWVDSICIDQSSIPERNQQVKLMGEIYGNAHEVIIWLGKEAQFTKAIFRAINDISLACSGDITDEIKRDDKIGKAVSAVNGEYPFNL